MLGRIALVAIAVALACAAVLIEPTPAWACSCAPTTTQQAVDRADAVFKGRVTERDRTGHGSDARIELRFEVSRVFKGRVFSDQVVLSPRDSAGCGIDAEVDSTWVIFATSGVEGTGDHAVTRLTTTLCSGNLPGATAAPALLGRGQFPRPGSSDTQEKTVRADARVDRALAIAGFTALGLIVLGGVALVLLWRPGRPT
ncbi:hypothetical protein [Microlunatus ginsengisoli]|uniref:Tissue inhibitor of metalloproteinase n=1 Tax=Microlunatus ginsengisoli TaxID=363863 RepID=A0ABP6ZC31_9ACTN